MREMRDLTGQRFGKLVALKPTERRIASGGIIWIFQCDCGNTHEVVGTRVTRGKTSSCGCDHYRTGARHAGYRHGKVGKSEYSILTGILQRCYNPKHEAFHRYGGRGIAVAQEWLDDNAAFFAYMGERPSSRHTVDRIDNDLGYQPGNVRWATRTEQQRNTKTNTLLTIGDETMPVVAWSERSGVRADTIYERLTRGWDGRKAVFAPVRIWTPKR